jgi:hypothetical protein
MGMAPADRTRAGTATGPGVNNLMPDGACIGYPLPDREGFGTKISVSHWNGNKNFHSRANDIKTLVASQA